MNTEAEVFKLLKRKLPEAHWLRLEAWVGAGIPDVNGAFLWPPEGQQRGFEIWCELKVCKLKTFKTAGLWRPSQIAYITKRSCKIANVWNLVSHPRAGLLKIYSGSKVLDLSTDSTGSIEPDLVLEVGGPWTTFLALAAERQGFVCKNANSTGSTDSPASTGSTDSPVPAGDPLGR